MFSGLFAELVWWPWAYWVLGIVTAALVGLTIIGVPDIVEPGTKPSLRELDLSGTLIGVLGLVLFNFAWNEGPSVGWDQVYVYALLIVGLVFLAVFFYIEVKVAAFPLLPVQAFTLETSLVFGCISAGWASFGIWVYYLW